MKKLFLFVTALSALTFLNSCSSDDNSDSNSGGSPGGNIFVKIDGVSKTFNNVIVDKETYTEDGETITELTVTGMIGNSTAEVITFGVELGDVGALATYYFWYMNGTNNYSFNGGFSSVVQTNSNNKLKGNFSGVMENNQSNLEDVNFSDGSYDISY